MTPSFFIKNRKKLLQRLPENALVVVTAQSLLQRSADTTFPFRQDSNFYYLTGIDEPDVVLVLSGSEEFLIMPKRSHAETIFGGSINYEDIAQRSGIKQVELHTIGWVRYKKMQQSRKNVYTLGAAPTKISHIDSYYTNPARRQIIQKLKRISPGIEIQDIRMELVRLRETKQTEEIEAIKQSIKITQQGFEKAHDLMTAGITENKLSAEFTKIFMDNQATHAYQPIVAGGTRACILHYIKNNQPLHTNEFCLLDVGAEYQNYAADITRSYFVGQKTTRQEAVYDAVFRVHKSVIKLLKCDMKWRDYSLMVYEILGEELISLGLIKNNTREEVRRYFPHGISHSLGLDVHDVCEYETIRENMIITVEPGIYIPEEGLGVRIEDNVLITKQGAINLSSSIRYE